MKKKVLFAATVATMLASCSSDSLSVQTAAKQEAQGLENAVSFEALSQRSLTRAGYAGVMDNNQLKEKGFGVFGYYTDLNEYDQTSTPNFMYNQMVSGGSWTYEPVKYWPNEYGNTAVSDDVDKLTFFAYAPYTENTPASGKVAEDQVGITGFTRATAAGDPYVKYIASLNPSECVDLCWGVANPDEDVTWDIIQGGSQTMPAGMPWMNVQRPQKSLGQKVKFFFKHALAQLNVQIDADVNTDTHGAGAEVDSKSKVYVRSITFNGFAMKGALNLNNEEANTPNWKGYGCNCEPLVTDEYTIYDGMKDGKEGTGYVASNEKVTGLNPTIIQDKKWADSEEGVTKTAKNLFNSTEAEAPIYVIPTGDDLSVTIVYDIETEDENLAGTVSDKETHGVSIENRISKTIKITGDGATAGQNLKLEAGKKYTVNLHLGMSQVEFDAEVKEWEENEASDAWLPANGEGEIYATDMTLDQESLNFNIGTADVQLTATVTPADATVSWSSSNTAVATVDATGLVHPVGPGSATIRATNSGGKTVSCSVTVAMDLTGLKSWINDGHADDKTYVGYYVSPSGDISENQNRNSIGYITHYGSEAVDQNAPDSRILVLATNYVSGTTAAWTTATITPSGYNDPNALNGIAFNEAFGDNSRYPVAYLVSNFNKAKPDGSSIWFLPSRAQWQLIFDGGKHRLTSARHWTCTEDEGNINQAYSFAAPDCSSFDAQNKKGHEYRIRPAFAY